MHSAANPAVIPFDTETTPHLEAKRPEEPSFLSRGISSINGFINSAKNTIVEYGPSAAKWGLGFGTFSALITGAVTLGCYIRGHDHTECDAYIDGQKLFLNSPNNVTENFGCGNAEQPHTANYTFFETDFVKSCRFEFDDIDPAEIQCPTGIDHETLKEIEKEIDQAADDYAYKNAYPNKEADREAKECALKGMAPVVPSATVIGALYGIHRLFKQKKQRANNSNNLDQNLLITEEAAQASDNSVAYSSNPSYTAPPVITTPPTGALQPILEEDVVTEDSHKTVFAPRSVR